MKIILLIYFLLTLTLTISAQNASNSSQILIQPSKDSAGTLLLWQKEVESRISAPITVSGKNIFLACADGKIFCFDLDGNLVWNYETGGSIVHKLAAENDVISAGIVEGDLFSFDAVTGELLQVIGLGELITSQPIIVDIINNGQKSKGIVVGTANGNLYCYDLFTFKPIWKNNSAEEAVGNKLVYTKDRIIFASRDNQLYCIDAETGIINWKWNNFKGKKPQVQNENSKTFIPAAGGNIVYIYDPEDKIVSAVDLLLGTTVWQKKYFKGWNSIVISGDNKKLFMNGSSGDLYIISAKEGKLIKEIKINFDPGESYSEPVEWNNNILLYSSSGRIYLIDDQYNWKPIISLAGASINSLANIANNMFAVSTSEGRIVVFKIN
jgi:outer membrane protein assembly factor BamB